MVKQNKMMCFDYEIIDFLKDAKPSASQYVQELIFADMNKLKKSKEHKEIDMNEVHKAVIVDAEALLKKEAERKAHNTAWDNLDLEVRVEIKDLPDWGVKWHTIFYPMYAAKGSLTLKDVRDWYFANKEGYKL